MGSVDPWTWILCKSCKGAGLQRPARGDGCSCRITSWRARWRSDEGGSRSKVVKRQVEGNRLVAKMETDKASGLYIDPGAGRMTVAQYWAEWSERQPWRSSSRTSITSLFNRHVLPSLGSMQLLSLRRGRIETWTAGLPLAPRTANQVAQYLSTMLDAAVDDGRIPTNPAKGAKRPRVEVEPIVPFTDDEVEELRSTTPGRYDVIHDLGLGAGLRQGEATGLTLDRLHFLRRELIVDRQLVTPLAGECTFGPPKTKRSYRTVPLADAVVERLSAHVAEYGTGEHGLLVHCDDGRPVRKQRFGAIWRKLRADVVRARVAPDDEAYERAAAAHGSQSQQAKAAATALDDALRIQQGVNHWRFHDERHTYASTLLSGGVPVPAAAEYLGHTAAELLRTYAHLLPADHDRARTAVQAAFDGWSTAGVSLVSHARGG
jgi:integrase